MNKPDKPVPHKRDITLPDDEAEASGPADESVLGEEDPGVALEELVEEEKKK